MSDVTIQKAPTWRPTGSVVAAALNPADEDQVLLAWSSGYFTTKGGAPLPSASFESILASGESVVDMHVSNWGTPSGYIFTSKARVLPFGGATMTGAATMLKARTDIKGGRAVAFAMNPSADGSGYWINAHGEIAAFGQVPALTTDNVERWVTRFNEPICRGWSFDWDTKRYMLLGANGQIILSPLAVGAAVTSSAQSSLSSSRLARSVTYNWEQGGGYIIDGHGRIYTVGGASPLPADPYWPNHDVGRLVLMRSWGVEDTLRYFVVDSAGAIHPRSSSTKPVVRIAAPLGASASWHLTTPNGDGIIRLRCAGRTSRALAYRSTVAQLEGALNDILGSGNFSLDPEGSGPGLDVGVTMTYGGPAPAISMIDPIGDATLTQVAEGEAAVITDTSMPTITWTYADAEDDAQGGWEVEVWKGSPAVRPKWDDASAVVPAWAARGVGTARSVKVDERLEDNTSYRVFVRAQERNGFWSDWAQADFSFNLDVPNLPRATIGVDASTASVVLSLDEAAMDLDPTNNAARDILWWERRREGTSAWELVRSSGTLRPSALHDLFDRPDSTTLGEPWLSLGGDGFMVLDGKAVSPPLPSSLVPFSRAVLTGTTPEVFEGKLSTLARLISMDGAVDRSWSPSVPLGSGGGYFRDDFERSSPLSLGSAADGTPWINQAGTWKVVDGTAWLSKRSTTMNNFATVDTGRSVGAFRTTFRLDAWTTAVTRVLVIPLAMEADDSGFHLGIGYNSTTNLITWNLDRYVDGAFDHAVDSGSLAFDIQTNFPGVYDITGELSEGALDLNFTWRPDGGSRVYIAPVAASTSVDLSGEDVWVGTRWGFGVEQLSTPGFIRFIDYTWSDPSALPVEGSTTTGAWTVDVEGYAEAMTSLATLALDLDVEGLLAVKLGSTLASGAESAIYGGWDGGDRGVALRFNASSAGYQLERMDRSASFGEVLFEDPPAAGDEVGLQILDGYARVFLNGAPVPVDTGGAPVLDVPIPSAYRYGSQWGVRSSGTLFGPLSFVPVAAQIDPEGVSGDTASLPSLPVSPLTGSDAVVASWVGAYSEPAPEESDLLGLVKAELAWLCSTRRTAITPASTTTITPGSEEGDVLFIGLRVDASATVEVTVDWETSPDEVSSESFSTATAGLTETLHALRVPHSLGEAITDVTVTVTAGSAQIEWWGVAPADSMEQPHVAVLGSPGLTGADAIANSAMSDAVDWVGLPTVRWTPLDADDVNENNLSGTLGVKLTQALSGDQSTTYDQPMASYVDVTTPTITALLGVGGIAFAGAIFDDDMNASSAVSVSAVEDPDAPGELALVVVRLVDGVAEVVETSSTGIPVTELASATLDARDHLDVWGTACGVYAFTPGVEVGAVAVGWSDAEFRDYEATPGVPHEYRMRVSTPNGEIVTAPAAIGTVTPPVVGYWLKDPLDPSLNMRVYREEDDFEVYRNEEQAVYEPEGRSRAIVVSGAVKAERLPSQIVSVKGQDQLDTLLALLNSGHPLLFQSPRRRQWYLRFGGEVTWKSILDTVLEGEELFTLTLPESVAVDAP